MLEVTGTFWQQMAEKCPYSDFLSGGFRGRWLIGRSTGICTCAKNLWKNEDCLLVLRYLRVANLLGLLG